MKRAKRRIVVEAAPSFPRPFGMGRGSWGETCPVARCLASGARTQIPRWRDVEFN